MIEPGDARVAVSSGKKDDGEPKMKLGGEGNTTKTKRKVTCYSSQLEQQPS